MRGPLTLSRVIVAAALIAAAAVTLTTPLESVAASRALALAIVTIALWATGKLPEHVTALMFFALVMLFTDTPAAVTFSGFHSGAFWLVFGGLVIGLCVNDTGLGGRMARRMIGAFGSTYPRVIFGILLFGMVLGFIMPSSMGRIMLLLPIVMTMARSLGFEEGTKGYTGMALATGWGCFFLPYGILPANVPNIIMVGIAEQSYGITPIYGEWLLLHLPVLGLLKGLVIGGLILWLFPATPQPYVDDEAPPPMTAREKRFTVIVALVLVAWATDFLHHVSPAWVALAGGIVCLLPGIGILPAGDFKRLNLASLFYAAGIIGLGAVVQHSGLGAVLADLLIDHAPLTSGQPFTNFYVVALIGIFVGIFTIVAGIPVFMTPVAEQIGQLTGFSVETVLMIQVISFSTPILPYAAAPLAICLQIARIRLSDASKLTALLTLVTIAVLIPLDYLWWKLIGWL